MDDDDYSPAHLGAHIDPDPFETTGFGLYNISLEPVYHVSYGGVNDFSVDYFLDFPDIVKVLVSNNTLTTKDYEIVIESDEERSNNVEELYGLVLANVPPNRALFSKNIPLNFDKRDLTMYIYEKNGRRQDRLVFKANISISNYPSERVDEFKQPKSGPIPKFYQEYTVL